MNLPASSGMCLPLSEREAALLSPLQLAHVGDSVHDLHVRSRLVLSGGSVGKMHKSTVACVNAKSQAQALLRVMPHLTDAEAAIVRRGRNADIHRLPANATQTEYRQATALECLLGYLYVSGQYGRLGEIWQWVDDAVSGT